MICFPNAKINLGLHILSKRSDGFHNIETFFYPIAWSDCLEVIENRSFVKGDYKIELELLGIELQSNGENLVEKAYHFLDARFDLPPVRVYLQKNIPAGAGLGGGSSDCAFMLSGMNKMFQLGVSKSELSLWASYLGSDCPFFLENKPAFASGKGEILTINEGFSLKDYYICVVFSGIELSTKEAYQNISPFTPEKRLPDLLLQDIRNWRVGVDNHFEKRFFAKFPELAAIKKQMYKIGAEYAAMSGSGSAIFGIFSEEPDAGSLAKFSQVKVWVGRG